jgi:hypothetical protein
MGSDDLTLESCYIGVFLVIIYVLKYHHYCYYYYYYTKVVRKIRFPMIFHNEKHVYWH